MNISISYFTAMTIGSLDGCTDYTHQSFQDILNTLLRYYL